MHLVRLRIPQQSQETLRGFGGSSFLSPPHIRAYFPPITVASVFRAKEAD